MIDPALALREWKPGADIKVEETAAPVDIIYGKGKRRPKGRTDYVLRRPLTPDGEPIALAILEAKREGLPPEHGLQQGKGYRVDVDLAETHLEAFLKLLEELAVLRQIVHINNDAHRVILENLTFMVPSPVNDLRFPSHGPELVLEFD